ncbi:hypothetical protein [Pseudomonas aeruginosa]|nr:hypothetical protein [Pseudomonas aeruginosa]
MGHEVPHLQQARQGRVQQPRFNASANDLPPYGKSIQKLVYKLFVR